MDCMVKIRKIIGVIQCRMTSKRLPAKAMLDLGGKTLLERVFLRAAKSNLIDEIWVATSTSKEDDVIEIKAKSAGYPVYRGPLDDVLTRFCRCIQETNAEFVVRITADNPFTEVKFIDLGIANILLSGCDYIGFKNVPYGSGVEIIKAEVMLKIDGMATTHEDREHVTLYLLNNSNRFNIKIIEPPWAELTRPDVRATIDTIEDYTKINNFFSCCQQNDSLLDYINFINNSIK
jgi:spore coat polysaccharide biosynthesis protein SpsF